MKRIKYVLSLLAVCAMTMPVLHAQSDAFNAGKYLEVQSTILRALENQFVDTVKTGELIRMGLESMLQSLDPYTMLIPEENEEDLELLTTGSYGGVGAVIQKKPGEGITIVEPYENSAAVRFGLEPGDRIIRIDGKEVYDKDATQCSNSMRGRPGTVLKLEVVKGRTGDTVKVDLIRDRIHVCDVMYYGMVDDTTGYINLGSFTMDGSKDVRKSLLDLKERGAKRLVLDLRNNGGGLMSEAVAIVSLFVPSQTLVVYSKGKHPNSHAEFKTSSEPVDTEMPLMVLVNSGSASSSEIVAGSLQDLDRAVIAGIRTYGKGLVQSIRPVGYNTNLKLTTAKYYIPSGRCVQAIDYSHRNADGSIGAIPDSLKKAFKTLGGRTVYDGGGIDPDMVVEPIYYSRPIAALIYSNIVTDYSLDYYRKHEDVRSISDIKISDEEYDRFVKFAASREFDNRTESQIKMEALADMAEKEQLTKTMPGLKEMLDALTDKMSLSKEEFLNTNKHIILPFLQNEIAVRYFFKRGGIESSLTGDVQLHNALKNWKSGQSVVEAYSKK